MKNTNSLSVAQLKALVTKTTHSLRQVQNALAERIEADNLRRAKELRHLVGEELLEACLVPVPKGKINPGLAAGLKFADRKKVVRYFHRRSLSGTSEFHVDFHTQEPQLYAKSKSGNIYYVAGDGRDTRLQLIGRGSKP